MRSSASTLAATLAKAREAPLCVPHFSTPRITAAWTRGSWSRPRKLSEPKLTTRRPSASTQRPDMAVNAMSFMWLVGYRSMSCSRNRQTPCCFKALPRRTIGG